VVPSIHDLIFGLNCACVNLVLTTIFAFLWPDLAGFSRINGKCGRRRTGRDTEINKSENEPEDAEEGAKIPVFLKIRVFISVAFCSFVF
jgi:hypothetical protein